MQASPLTAAQIERNRHMPHRLEDSLPPRSARPGVALFGQEVEHEGAVRHGIGGVRLQCAGPVTRDLETPDRFVDAEEGDRPVRGPGRDAIQEDRVVIFGGRVDRDEFRAQQAPPARSRGHGDVSRLYQILILPPGGALDQSA